MTKTLLAREVDFSKIKIEKKKPVQKGGPEQCRVKYDGDEFVVQGPRIRVPFGLSQPKEEFKTENDKFTFQLSLDTSNPKIAEFKDFLEKLDNFNIENISKNSKDIFGDFNTPDEIKKHKLYTFLIKKPPVEKSTYPDTFKVKLPVYSNKKVGFKVEDQVGKEIVVSYPLEGQEDVKEDKDKKFSEPDWSWCVKNMEIIPIMKFEGFWFISGKMHPVWKMMKVKIYPPQQRDFSFREVDDEQDTGKYSSTNVVPDDEDNSQGQDKNVGSGEDSGDEEEVSEDEDDE